ncbi:MAG TPA: hypothetical protein VF553_09660 [Pyrinomonadaceae bacterium]|jgi:uncharacterized membrane protein YuzA (DUF378 family)
MSTLSARPKINIAYVIIGTAAIIMLAALLSAPRIRKYAREKARAESAAPAATTTAKERP